MMRAAALILVALLVASPALGATVEVSWNANAEADLAGYKVYYGTASGALGVCVDVGNETKSVIAITPTIGTRYYFAVTAYDTSGNESDKSPEVSILVPDDTAPASPKSIILKILQQIAAWLKGMKLS